MSNLPLQMALYFNVITLPLWIILMILLIYKNVSINTKIIPTVSYEQNKQIILLWSPNSINFVRFTSLFTIFPIQRIVFLRECWKR